MGAGRDGQELRGMIRVWMNHWFSTAVSIIELLKAGRGDVYVIGSNEHEYSVIRNVCDEWYREPVLPENEYVEFCLRFCEEHRIGVFMPRRGMVKISEQKERFEAAGVRVMMDDYAIVSVLNQKESAYRYFQEYGIAPVPDYRIVRTVKEFREAYGELAGKYPQVCFKFVRDEGGKSFRLIDNQRKGYAALFKKQNTRMTLDDALDALSEREVFAPLMVMPFLPDEEISVDCLDTAKGLIALPRVKGYEKYETLRYDPEILAICEKFQDTAGLRCPYNIQFKYLNGVPFFLEVNTRMSGGVQMACHASGVNIPQIALDRLLGRETDWENAREPRLVAQVLRPVTLGPYPDGADPE